MAKKHYSFEDYLKENVYVSDLSNIEHNIDFTLIAPQFFHNGFTVGSTWFNEWVDKNEFHISTNEQDLNYINVFQGGKWIAAYHQYKGQIYTNRTIQELHESVEFDNYEEASESVNEKRFDVYGYEKHASIQSTDDIIQADDIEDAIEKVKPIFKKNPKLLYVEIERKGTHAIRVLKDGTVKESIEDFEDESVNEKRFDVYGYEEHEYTHSVHFHADDIEDAIEKVKPIFKKKPKLLYVEIERKGADPIKVLKDGTVKESIEDFEDESVNESVLNKAQDEVQMVMKEFFKDVYVQSNSGVETFTLKNPKKAHKNFRGNIVIFKDRNGDYSVEGAESDGESYDASELKAFLKQTVLSESLNEASLNKLYKDLAKVQMKMKELAKKYKDGDKSVVPELKKLTSQKKKLEAQIEDEVGMLDDQYDESLTEADMSKYSVGDIIKWRSPKGIIDGEIIKIDSKGYLKIKYGKGSEGTIPYQSVVESMTSDNLKIIYKKIKPFIKGNNIEKGILDYLDDRADNLSDKEMDILYNRMLKLVGLNPSDYKSKKINQLENDIANKLAKELYSFESVTEASNILNSVNESGSADLDSQLESVIEKLEAVLATKK